MEKNTPQDMNEGKTYEVGYLLNPLMPAEKVEESVEAVFKSAIEAAGGNIILKIAPKMRELAYPVSKSINNKKSIYKDAYFGAVKFQIASEDLKKVREVLDKTDDIIRFLLIVAPRVDERAAPRRPFVRRPVEAAAPRAEEEKGGEMSEEQIDKEIDDLLDTATA